ncbi:DEAD-box ATP-dependent RNA helicase 25 [Grifola frondosa]|uniref:ATP-dependent RNA helicase n=1 Tax=Grifola frondosa TaxID=5627 RepID=A0A1C7MMJ3_GRIFR|nr:DEAD-box ATP-dependent RNA helicase 25 [Grifola frondosa]
MVASIWAKASAASTFSALNVFRASRCARASVFHARRATAIRWSTTATAKQPNLDPGAYAEPADQLEEDASSTTPSVNEDQPKFTTLRDKISPETMRAITVRPFKLTHMSPVQAVVLPLLPELAEPYNPDASPEEAEGRMDLLVKARTGTGKTLGFLVPAIEARLKEIEAYRKQLMAQSVSPAERARAVRFYCRANIGTLILSPTRELATQIANEALRLAHHHEDFEVRLCVGGASKRLQMRDWVKGRRDIVVATPGRMLDLVQNEPEVQNCIDTTKMLILDEADTLMDMGFREDIQAIVQKLPPSPQRQTFMFSATVSTAIQQVARVALNKNHKFINCVPANAPPVHSLIPQYHTVLAEAEDQIPHILRLIAHDQLTNPGKSKIIIFFPTTRMTQLFSTILRNMSSILPSSANSRFYEIHSKKTQDSRTRTSDMFRSDKSGGAVLCSSDVSARGVDYPGVTRVIQVGIPSGADIYVHRVGRTGRGSHMQGRADLVLLPWEIGFVTWQLTDIPLKPLTSGELTKQVMELAEKYDKDPDAFFPPSLKFDKKGRSFAGPKPFVPRVATGLQQMPSKLEDLLKQVDPDAIRETLASLVGFYFPKSPELRVQKSVILEGCRDWTTGACGLAQPPYISDSLLQKLGMSDGRTKHWGRNTPSFTPRRSSSSEPSWMGRGTSHKKVERRNEEFKDMSRYRKEGAYGSNRSRRDRDEDEVDDVPFKEYIGKRYSQKRSSDRY